MSGGGVIAGFVIALSFVLAGYNFFVASQAKSGLGHEPVAWWIGGGFIMVVGLVAAGAFLHNFP